MTTTTEPQEATWHLVADTDNATLSDALTTFSQSHPGAIGYVMSPRAAYWIRHTDDGWCRAIGRDAKSGLVTEKCLDPAELNAAFEARAFANSADPRNFGELRWIHVGEGSGSAVTITTLAADAAGPTLGGAPATLPDAKAAERLLWGEATGAPTRGWAEMADARIGAYLVPFAGKIAEHERLVFDMLEFVEVDQHGNCFVVDELIGRIRKIGQRKLHDGATEVQPTEVVNS